MTEKEVMYRQEQNGQQEFYLTLVDSKIYAYGYGAFALSRLTGHRVRRQQHTELGQLHMVWIPAVYLDSLRVKLFFGILKKSHSQRLPLKIIAGQSPCGHGFSVRLF